MSRVRASPKDRQSEVRTKIADEDWDAIERYAAELDITTYQAAREIILIGLDALRLR